MLRWKPINTMHLRNAPTKLMKQLGYGQEYKYAHSYEGNFVKQQFLPDELKDKRIFASLMPLIIPGVKRPMSTPAPIAMTIHRIRGIFLSTFMGS